MPTNRGFLPADQYRSSGRGQIRGDISGTSLFLTARPPLPHRYYSSAGELGRSSANHRGDGHESCTSPLGSDRIRRISAPLDAPGSYPKPPPPGGSSASSLAHT